MARIGGITLPSEKQIHIAITSIYGIGRFQGMKILEKANIDPTIRVKDMTDAQVSKISEIIHDEYLTEGELQRVVSGNIKRLKDIRSYRGSRHSNNLPSRGQRTRTNARTKRGKKVAVGGTQKKAAAKT